MRRTHGLYGTSICNRWQTMLARCYQRTHQKFHRYGGRGIKVCELLRSSPANLKAVLGEQSTPDLTVGRILNDGMYSCGSCAECLEKNWPINIQWETQKQQQNKRGNNRMLTFGNETKTAAEWAAQAGIPYIMFFKRWKRGRDPFVTPLRTRKPTTPVFP